MVRENEQPGKLRPTFVDVHSSAELYVCYTKARTKLLELQLPLETLATGCFHRWANRRPGQTPEDSVRELLVSILTVKTEADGDHPMTTADMIMNALVFASVCLAGKAPKGEPKHE